jgi:hypothetical protein
MLITSPSTKLPPFKVSIWEVLAVAISAILLIAAGVTGLAYKFFVSASNPERATAIADDIMDYELPGKAEGRFGVNFAGAKVALLSNKTADVKLLVARVPVNKDTDRRETEQWLEKFLISSETSSTLMGMEKSYVVNASRVENQNFCGATTPITITEGQLTLPKSNAAVFAVNYKASLTLPGTRYSVVILAEGQQAKQNAAAVFRSLNCQ